MKKLLCIFSLWILPLALRAQPIDDSDLIGPRLESQYYRLKLSGEGRREEGLRFYSMKKSSPESGSLRPRSAAVFGRFVLIDSKGNAHPGRLAKVLLMQNGKAVRTAETDGEGLWSFPASGALLGSYRVHFRLENSLWSLREAGSGTVFEWQGPEVVLEGGKELDAGAWSLEPGSQNGKAGWIHLTYLEAVDFFSRNRIGLEWWTRRRPLGVFWPGDGDYFVGWSLNLTHPEAWDVNLHELGHAVQDAATRSTPAGGSHKIDECYGRALAWSEGFATFFAAAVHLSPDDPDAKFEYLVPRRAPIRIENVPADVCRGDSSEWRVAAALWDLMDTSEDAEDHVSIAFKTLWQSWLGQRMGGILDAWALTKKILPPELQKAGERALAQNTILSGTVFLPIPEKPSLIFFE